MINYSQRIERVDGKVIYYFSFADTDIDVVESVSNNKKLKDKIHALSVATAKGKYIRITMPYWTNDDVFLKQIYDEFVLVKLGNPFEKIFGSRI